MKQLAKREGILFLLDHWRDIFDPDGTTAAPLGGRTRGGDEDGVPLLPKIARTRSVEELEECVAALKRYTPNHHAHLMFHYLAEWKIEYVPAPVLNRRGQQALDKHGNPVTELRPQRKRLLPAWSDDDRAAHYRMVNRSIDFLCATYRLSYVRIEENDDLEAAA